MDKKYLQLKRGGGHNPPGTSCNYDVYTVLYIVHILCVVLLIINLILFYHIYNQ